MSPLPSSNATQDKPNPPPVPPRPRTSQKLDLPPLPPRLHASPCIQPMNNPTPGALPISGVATHNSVPSPSISDALQGKPNPPPVPARSYTSQKPDHPPVPPRPRTSPANQPINNPTAGALPVSGVAAHVPSPPISDALQGKPNPPPVPPRSYTSQKPDCPPVPPRPRTSPRNHINNPTASTLPISGVTTHIALSSFPMSEMLQGRSGCPSDPPTPPCSQPPAQGILEGAKDFKIENSVLTNVQGNALMFRFDGPPTEEFKNIFTHHVEGLVTIKDLDRIAMTTKEHGLSQAIRDLPRAKAAYNDYTSSKRRRTACFKNTRQSLLKEIALCATSTNEPRAYFLFGIAGVGKSTVAQTVAEKADTLRLLGASFFFSRDEADCRTAEKFFTSIAFQLCAYDKQFAEAIGAALTKERGAAATSKDPQDQLTILILEPLRGIDRSHSLPTVIVVDALDECDVDDGPIILMALSRLVQELPSFRVVLTSRPQPRLQHLLDRLGAHQAFRMEDIEQKVVEGDIRLYLKHSLSLGQVYDRLQLEWAADDEDIDALVRAAGRLFIIASTAVLFILDIFASNPASRITQLRDELSQNRTPFNTLNDFYTVILRTAVPRNCERDIVKRYQSVVGAIVLIEDPLPVGPLARLIGVSGDDVRSALRNLQSVVSIGSDNVPLVYHKSFPDYITDDQRCQDTDLRIAPRGHHTRLATRCLYIMNLHLKYNILGLGAISQYLDNKKALEEEQLSRDDIQRVIPCELQYASVHWAEHVAQADFQDNDLMTELKTFTEEHLLHWLEALSWLCKLDTAHIPLGIALKLQTLDSDTHQIFLDALRFVSRDYQKIEQAALFIYHSALPFTPIETPLYKRYKRQLSLCQVEGGPAQWDILVAEKKHGGNIVYHLAFAHDSSQFASWGQDSVKLWDGASGTLIGSFDGNQIALADDFSVLAVPQDSSVTIYSVSSTAPIASFDHSSPVIAMTISFNGSRLATGLEDGTVHVWDVVKGVSIATLDEYDNGLLAFSPHGYMLAFASKSGINLWNRVDMDIVATLEHELGKPFKIAFSDDGTRLATLATKDDLYSLKLWNGLDGNFIAVATDVGGDLAFSVDGSFIATGGWEKDEVQVWSGSSLAHVDTIPIRGIWDLGNMALSGGMLAVTSWSHEAVILYDIKSKASIATLKIKRPMSLAFSPDGTRLAAGNLMDGAVHLWDVPSIGASAPTPKQELSTVRALALSQDCSRVASGHYDGSVGLWDTGNMRQPIACHRHHSDRVDALAFSPDGNQLASGSDDNTVKLWDGRYGSPIGILEHAFYANLTSVAFSSNLLAAATRNAVTLWDRTSLCLIHTFQQGSWLLSFSHDSSTLVSSERGYDGVTVTVWDTENLMVTATFTASRDITIPPSPNGSKLAVQDLDSGFTLFDVINKEMISDPEDKDLSWIPHLNGIPMSWDYSTLDGHRLMGRLSARHDCAPILWIPRGLGMWASASQSSTFALGCKDGRILLIRPPVSH